jgi:hypothetical protein
MMKEKSGVVCVNCGIEPEKGNARGSLQHPYCSVCFKKVWNNDYEKYQHWLLTKHNVR